MNWNKVTFLDHDPEDNEQQMLNDLLYYGGYNEYAKNGSKLIFRNKYNIILEIIPFMLNKQNSYLLPRYNKINSYSTSYRTKGYDIPVTKDPCLIVKPKPLLELTMIDLPELPMDKSATKVFKWLMDNNYKLITPCDKDHLIFINDLGIYQILESSSYRRIPGYSVSVPGRVHIKVKESNKDFLKEGICTTIIK